MNMHRTRRCEPERVIGPGQRAFTLPEVLVAMGIFVGLMAMMMVANMFGIRMHEMTKVKLGASDEARRAVNLLSSEIRSAKIIRIGNGNATEFAEVPINTPQQGSAIQIHPTTNTADFVRYFWDNADSRLKRTLNGSNIVTVVANFITNQLVFTSEDGLGNVLTNNQNNRVIGLKLEFYQLQYPVTKIGPGNYYDYYRLSTKVTRRALE
jgi:prepilin-type N-terminal cleavage/methylation domain-containing protein